MQLASTLAWLVDAAAETPTPERFLADLGNRLIADGAPLAGGALTLTAPHPLIARRTWLWRADGGEVIEALGFLPGGLCDFGGGGRRRRALGSKDLASDPSMRTPSRQSRAGRALGWIGPRPFTPDEADRLREAARFAAAPLAALTARATLTAALEAYLGRRSAARVLAGPLRRGVGETIQAALLFADLRGFTALSESNPPSAVISALDAWFDRIAGSVHAFGGEVLKFMGDGVLAIFPGRRRDAARRLRRGAQRGRRRPSRNGASRRSATTGGPRASALRRRAASRRDPVGQYRRRRPARFHRDRPGRQSGQPARGPMPAARQGGPHLGRLRRRDRPPLVPLGEHALRGIAAPCAVFTVKEDLSLGRSDAPGDGAQVEAQSKNRVHRDVDGADRCRLWRARRHEAHAERRLHDKPGRDEKRNREQQAQSPGSASDPKPNFMIAR